MDFSHSGSCRVDVARPGILWTQYTTPYILVDT
jgi:hypothetical protein